ncbi:MBL fold metallo-hydrolase [Sulfolobus sp. E5-1-F]|uniref:MBL fold metallo-hydrolase n=1 Tax=Sulfolobaceae TaxID=118883 RepID=UPI00129506D7|nr:MULTISPECIES: MBL fold metallo-hydrolase [unclassified Sulfolobus]QGA55156.1 MBL fold metallo-hydrolase [Sulfolobus sp. E5-1-F]QGA67958.1 MBL fold metallo-hydrolase [Sulfolobus sp. E11-6]
MKITFVGTGAGSSLGLKRVKSSILINDKVLLDLGPGAELRLEDTRINPKALFITHLHVDHFSGIFDYLVQRKIRQIPDLEIYSPKGFLEVLNPCIKVGNNISAKIYEANLPSGKIDELEIYSIQACHSIYAVSYIISDGNTRVLYTGDTKEPCNTILENAKDVDLIIHEATCINDCTAWGHTSIKQLFELFGNKRIIATHIPAEIEEKIISLTSNKIIIAFDGLSLNV